MGCCLSFVPQKQTVSTNADKSQLLKNEAKVAEKDVIDTHKKENVEKEERLVIPREAMYLSHCMVGHKLTACIDWWHGDSTGEIDICDICSVPLQESYECVECRWHICSTCRDNGLYSHPDQINSSIEAAGKVLYRFRAIGEMDQNRTENLALVQKILNEKGAKGIMEKFHEYYEIAYQGNLIIQDGKVSSQLVYDICMASNTCSTFLEQLIQLKSIDFFEHIKEASGILFLEDVANLIGTACQVRLYKAWAMIALTSQWPIENNVVHVGQIILRGLDECTQALRVLELLAPSDENKDSLLEKVKREDISKSYELAALSKLEYQEAWAVFNKILKKKLGDDLDFENHEKCECCGTIQCEET